MVTGEIEVETVHQVLCIEVMIIVEEIEVEIEYQVQFIEVMIIADIEIRVTDQASSQNIIIIVKGMKLLILDAVAGNIFPQGLITTKQVTIEDFILIKESITHSITAKLNLKIIMLIMKIVPTFMFPHHIFMQTTKV